MQNCYGRLVNDNNLYNTQISLSRLPHINKIYKQLKLNVRLNKLKQ